MVHFKVLSTHKKKGFIQVLGDDMRQASPNQFQSKKTSEDRGKYYLQGQKQYLADVKQVLNIGKHVTGYTLRQIIYYQFKGSLVCPRLVYPHLYLIYPWQPTVFDSSSIYMRFSLIPLRYLHRHYYQGYKHDSCVRKCVSKCVLNKVCFT